MRMFLHASRGQGAPSTIRCIKTSGQHVAIRDMEPVREHPAPLGALRRHEPDGETVDDSIGQGAPSTIRCIKTSVMDVVSPYTVQSGSAQHH